MVVVLQMTHRKAECSDLTDGFGVGLAFFTTSILIV
jgi:hypothetical protein